MKFSGQFFRLTSLSVNCTIIEQTEKDVRSWASCLDYKL